MNKFVASALGGLLLASMQLGACAHAPVVVRFSLPVHHAATNALLPLHFSGATRAFNKLSVLPQSGSTRAFNATLKSITGLSIRNTVLNAPLTNVSGQLATVNYYATRSGYPNQFYAYPAINYLGSNPLNTSGYANSINVTSVANVFQTGLKPVNGIFDLYKATGLSGAVKAHLNIYNAAATNGYNAGLNVLQHPTGGMLFGTAYFGYGSQPAQSYPEFFAFGNNPYAQNALASQGYKTYVDINSPLTSYLQFGKITRVINNGILSGTDYFPNSYGPPYLPYAGSYYNQGSFILAMAANKLNTGLYGHYLNTTAYLKTFFQ